MFRRGHSYDCQTIFPSLSLILRCDACLVLIEWGSFLWLDYWLVFCVQKPTPRHEHMTNLSMNHTIFLATTNCTWFDGVVALVILFSTYITFQVNFKIVEFFALLQSPQHYTSSRCVFLSVAVSFTRFLYLRSTHST